MSRKSLRNRPPQVSISEQPTLGSQQITFQAATYSSPFLPAAEMERYTVLLPDAPKRIFTLVEGETDHRHGLERWMVKGDIVRAILGVIFAFLLGLAAIWVGANLVLRGATAAGTIFAGTGLGSVLGAFIYGTRVRFARNR